MNQLDLINEVNAKLEALMEEVELAYRQADDILEPIEYLEFMLGKETMEYVFDKLDFAVAELAGAIREIKNVKDKMEGDFFVFGKLSLSDEYIEQYMDKEIFKQYKRG